MFEWGGAGLRAIAARCAVVIVVDVLSFSTASEVATSTGARVLPLRWRDERANLAAKEAGAVLAAPRSTSAWSLSPSALRQLDPEILLALPSPNGAALCDDAATLGITVFTGCLRNATAVARAAQHAAASTTIGVIAAGERWGDQDGPLRPAIEDQLGAGAIITALEGSRSAEAEFAETAYRAVSDRVSTLITESVSGRELDEWGFGSDVALAGEVDVSDTTPKLRDGTLEGI